MKNQTSFTKGHKKRGRPPGAPNKVQQSVKEAFELMVKENIPNFNIWIAQIAEKDPAKAMDIILKMSEFIIPKITRSEITAEDGKPFYSDIKVEIVKPYEDTDYTIISEN